MPYEMTCSDPYSNIDQVIMSKTKDPIKQMILEYVSNSADAEASEIRVDEDNIFSPRDIIIDDNGIGFTRNAMDDIHDINKSEKRHRIKYKGVGFRGIGRLIGFYKARIVIVDTNDGKGYSEVTAILHNSEKREMLVWRGRLEKHDTIKKYISWRDKDERRIKKRGVRLVISGLEEKDTERIRNDADSWIKLYRRGDLSNREYYLFGGQSILSSAGYGKRKRKRWTLKHNLEVDGKKISGRLFYYKDDQEPGMRGIILRACNAGIPIGMANDVVHIQYHNRINGEIDASDVITREDLMVDKDGLQVNDKTEELLKIIRRELDFAVNTWTKSEIKNMKKKEMKILDILWGPMNLIWKSEMDKPLPIIKNDVKGMVSEKKTLGEGGRGEGVGRKKNPTCVKCGKSMKGVHFKKGVITPKNANDLNIGGDEIDILVGSKYRYRICPFCGTTNSISLPPIGESVPWKIVVDRWKWDSGLEYVFKNYIYINGTHPNYKRAQKRTETFIGKKVGDAKPEIMFGTPYNIYLNRCVFWHLCKQKFTTNIDLVEIEKYVSDLEMQYFNNVSLAMQGNLI